MRSLPVLAALLLALAPAMPARTQVVPDALPPLPRPPVNSPLDALGGTVFEAADGTLDTALGYRVQVEALLRDARGEVVRAPGDALMRHAEYLAMDLDDATRAAAAAAGFEVVREDIDADLGLSVTLLRDRRGRSPARALRALRDALPGHPVEPHHLFFPAGGLPAGVLPASGQAGPGADAPATDATMRVGLVDGGVDATAPSIARARVVRHGCDGRAVPQAHGTQVATRLLGGAPATLFAADLWCGQRVGGDTLALVDALRWMARERVAVVNVSLVGPDNVALRRVVEALSARGHVIVAAAGNDGPAAPPRYPAAYPGVVAVAAVDARGLLLPESAVGKHITACADGVVDARARTRGTSFAAPIVAHVLARAWPVPRPGRNAEARQVLARAAQPARSPRCGLGLVPPS